MIKLLIIISSQSQALHYGPRALRNKFSLSENWIKVNTCRKYGKWDEKCNIRWWRACNYSKRRQVSNFKKNFFDMFDDKESTFFHMECKDWITIFIKLGIHDSFKNSLSISTNVNCLVNNKSFFKRGLVSVQNMFQVFI